MRIFSSHIFYKPCRYSQLKPAALLIVLLLFITGAHSQSLAFKNYSTGQGLITDEVYNLFQDQQGYLWVFSKYGTLKYNGIEFKPVLKNLPYKESFIYTIYENSRGRKWVANSNARIYEVRNDSAFMIHGFEEASAGLRNAVSEITWLYVDDSLTIFVNTKGLSYKLIKKGNSYVPVSLDAPWPPHVQFSIYERGPVLMRLCRPAAKIGSNAYDPNSQYLKFTESSDSCHLPVLRMGSTPRNLKRFGNSIYFVAADYLIKIRDKKITWVSMGVVALNYTRDKNGHIWVGCLNGGLFELNEKDSIINHYLDNSTVNDVLIDHEDGLWVSTPDLGLFRCANLMNRYFSKPHPLAEPVSMIKATGDTLFVANKKGDLFMLHKDQWLHVRQADNNTPREMIRHNGNLVMLSSYLLETWSPAMKLRSSLHAGNPGTYYTVFSKSSDTLICTWRRGIIFFVKGIPQKVIDFNHKILSSALTDNILWLGTETGVYSCKPAFTVPGQKSGEGLIPDKEPLLQPAGLLPTHNSAVTNIVCDNEKNLWFCTDNEGLFKLSNSRFSHYETRNGLPGGIINSLSFTADNSALLSTNNGLFRSSPVEAGDKPVTWETIYEGAVKSSLQFEGKVYAGVKSGFTVLTQEKEGAAENKLFLNLASIQVDAKEVSTQNFKSISSRQSDLVFAFDLISFSGTKPLLKYRLQGPVKDEGLVSASVKFSRLTPGSYTLSVAPVTGGSQPLQLLIPFHVIPAFWQTAWFLLLVVAIIVLLLAASFFLSMRYTNKKQLMKARNEQLLLEYKLIALKAQINPHFISNCLSAIQNLIKNGNINKAMSYVAKFGLVVRQILDFSSRQNISLAEELEMLNLYLGLEQLRFENKFTFEICIDESISATGIFLPPLLLNPIVENAIWHGLLPLYGERPAHLKIKAAREAGCLVLSIQDNGVGRNKTKDELNNYHDKSYGIQITEQRLSNLNNLYKSTEAKLEYEDLFDPENEPAGTLAIIYLPLILTPYYHEQD